MNTTNIAEVLMDNSSQHADTGSSSDGEAHYPRVVLQSVLLILTSIVGLLGNTLLVYLILSRKNLRNICNYYILNGAVAEILLQFTGFLLISSMLRLKFDFGYAGCLFLYIPIQVGFLIGLINYILMCVDCYKSTPHGYSSPTYRANLLKRGLCSLWIICGILAIPIGFLTIYVEDVAEDGVTVNEAFCAPSPVLFAWTDIAYIGQLLFYCIIPLTVMWVYLFKAFRYKSGNNAYSANTNEDSHVESYGTGDVATDKPDGVVFSKQFITTLAILFTIFELGFWLSQMNQAPSINFHVPYLYEIGLVMLDLNAAIKPIICFMYVRDLHEEFIKLLPKHRN